MARHMAPSDYVPVVGTVDPQLVDNAAVTSDWVDIGDFAWVLFVVNIGATDITVDAKVQSADDSSGTNAADITGLSATQLTASDDNKQVVFAVHQSQVNTDDTHVACVVTVGDGTTGAYVSVVALGFGSNYQPASFVDLSTVAEIVTT